MTTRAPGLTAAMERGLIDRSTANCTTLQRLYDRGLISDLSRMSEVTPRGQAALAAPRMTAAELRIMEWAGAEKRIPTGLMLTRAYRSLWNRFWLEPDEATGGKLTPAGLTALNNMRAAMGGAEYKETV
jgi:hypothetical protein